ESPGGSDPASAARRAVLTDAAPGSWPGAAVHNQSPGEHLPRGIFFTCQNWAGLRYLVIPSVDHDAEPDWLSTLSLIGAACPAFSWCRCGPGAPPDGAGHLMGVES